MDQILNALRNVEEVAESILSQTRDHSFRQKEKPK